MKVSIKGDNVVISDFNEVEALKLAIKIEKDGINAYNEAIKKVSDEKMKKTLVRIGEDEEDHLRLFTSLYDNLLKDNGVNPADVDVEEGIMDQIDTGIFDGLKDLTSAGNAAEVIDRGVDVEAKTLSFYLEIYKGLKSDQSRQRIKGIIEQEKMHYNILKSWLGVFK